MQQQRGTRQRAERNDARKDRRRIGLNLRQSYKPEPKRHHRHDDAQIDDGQPLRGRDCRKVELRGLARAERQKEQQAEHAHPCGIGKRGNVFREHFAENAEQRLADDRAENQQISRQRPRAARGMRRCAEHVDQHDAADRERDPQPCPPIRPLFQPDRGDHA